MRPLSGDIHASTVIPFCLCTTMIPNVSPIKANQYTHPVALVPQPLAPTLSLASRVYALQSRLLVRDTYPRHSSI